MKSNRLLLLGILTLTAMSLCLAAPARAVEGHFVRTVQVSGAVDLEVQTGSGTVDVRRGDSSTVRITGTIRTTSGWFDGTGAENKVHYLEANPPIEQHGNAIKIGRIEDEDLQRNISISYEIVAPVETRLRSNSGSGEQNVSGLRGPVEASSGSGNLRLTNIGDMVRASTGSGRISVEGVKGTVRASTGSGEILATGVAGGLHASTGSGSVTLRQTAPGAECRYRRNLSLPFALLNSLASDVQSQAKQPNLASTDSELKPIWAGPARPSAWWLAFAVSPDKVDE